MIQIKYRQIWFKQKGPIVIPSSCINYSKCFISQCKNWLYGLIFRKKELVSVPLQNFRNATKFLLNFMYFYEMDHQKLILLQNFLLCDTYNGHMTYQMRSM
jgi:hypothetical protein